MRLTIRNSDGTVSQPMNLDWSAALEKLAAYEDAEEQGRMVILPCKVGDKVYWCPMGVYIKGMEMPTNEDMEPTAILVYPNGYAIVFRDNGKMQQYTEAVPVPPHGRLIDADALDGIMVEQSGEEYNHHHAPRTWERALSCFRDYIKDAPTIIQAEEDE